MFNSISATELKQKLDSNEDMIVVDVRSASEFADEKIDHPKVKNIELGFLPGRINEVKEISDNIFLLCQSGSRSAMAQMILKAKGIKSANISGGMYAWSQAGF